MSDTLQFGIEKPPKEAHLVKELSLARDSHIGGGKVGVGQQLVVDVCAAADILKGNNDKHKIEHFT